VIILAEFPSAVRAVESAAAAKHEWRNLNFDLGLQYFRVVSKLQRGRFGSPAVTLLRGRETTALDKYRNSTVAMAVMKHQLIDEQRT
jgi:hypothetical protein